MVNSSEPSSPPDPGEEALDAPIAVAVAVPISNQDLSSESDSSDVPLASHAMTDDDVEAQEVAEEARRQGIASIRSHLDHHLSENPNISYVSWIACLHPENATVSIDPRFFIEGNPWLTVFEEAKNDLQKGGSVIHVIPEEPSTSSEESSRQQSVSQKSGFSGLIDWIIGVQLVLLAVLIASALEIIATCMYLSFRLCRKIATRCSDPRITILSVVPFSFAWSFEWIFRLLEVSLFITSILTVEFIAWSNAACCTTFALSFTVGRHAHQTTRRLAHHTRWAFRRCFDKWEPGRVHF